ncbi:hypothetical protein K443DRAFT_543052 [Laccaria amethystina LaAM-08-1]|uniref:Uncharacterized protein n=1 Tax=Laccaria amethystina LaAM-08-1 TaxID=1095629 RepID=A0A0C9X1U1_9AGAR|nr:hypothetical protein K443DRAFT_543052 [Laccaria amethystina LaAM-08-1]
MESSQRAGGGFVRFFLESISACLLSPHLPHSGWPVPITSLHRMHRLNIIFDIDSRGPEHQQDHKLVGMARAAWPRPPTPPSCQA